MIASNSIYQKQLPVETIEQLQEKQMTPTKPRVSWWPFSGKKVKRNSCFFKAFFKHFFFQSDVTNEHARSEALAKVAKSEVESTILKNRDFIRNNS